MNPKIIVLFSADPIVQEVVTSAALDNRHGLRLADTSESAVKVLAHDYSDADLFIIDLDEDIHGVSLLTALTFESGAPPIVLLTSFEPNYSSRLAAATGVKALFGKPIEREQMAEVIHRLIGGPSADGAVSGCVKAASGESRGCCARENCESRRGSVETVRISQAA